MILDPWPSFIWYHQYDNTEEFNKDIIDTCKALIAFTPEPVADHNVDLWCNDNMKIIRGYFEEGFNELCNNYNQVPDYDIDSLNIINPMKYGDFKSCHTHDHIDAFGVYYINESEEGGNLRLYDPRFLNKKTFCNSPYIEIKPKTGLCIVAPYYVWHEVTPYLGEETRISLVCNMVLKNDFRSS